MKNITFTVLLPSIIIMYFAYSYKNYVKFKNHNLKLTCMQSLNITGFLLITHVRHPYKKNPIRTLIDVILWYDLYLAIFRVYVERYSKLKLAKQEYKKNIKRTYKTVGHVINDTESDNKKD